MSDPGRLYLVDASGFIFRAYHALPPLSRKDGTPVGAVFGFCAMLAKLIEEAKGPGAATHLAAVFDAGRHTFRNELYPAYKAHRPPAPEDLVPQFPLTREAAEAFGVPALECTGFEADDVIATLARRGREAGGEVVIVSSDKDLMQLVGDRVSMLDPIKLKRIDAEAVREKFGVGPERVVDVQALAGDPTDNVPGVPGIGIKTAAQLINEYGDLDRLLERAAEIRQPKRREALLGNRDNARISRELVRLRDDVPLDLALDALALKPVDPAPLGTFLRRMEFERLANRLSASLAAAPAATGGAAARPSLVASGPRPPVAPTAALRAEASTAAPAATETYELVQEEADLARWIEAATARGEVAFDTETTSLDAMRADLVGVSLALEPGRACYIPLGHVGRRAQGSLALEPEAGAEAERPRQIPLDRALAALKPLLEDPAVLKIGQNLKYDMQVLLRHGIRIRPIDDTMLLSYVLDGGLHGHGMDELALLHLQHKTISYKEVTGSGRDQLRFDEVALEKALAYAAEDADVTLKLHRVLKPRLLPEHMVSVYETLERPLVEVLVTMERAGIRADPAELKRLSTDFAGRMAGLEAQIHELAGEAFNVASPKQLGEILFERMALPGGKKGKTGAYGTGADVLEALAAAGHDLPARVLDWRQLAKLKSTYTDALLAEINPLTGRVHTSYAMAATTTGRLASTDPNLQNIPVRTEEGRKIRHAFVAEPGHLLLSADYSQIELRLLAHVADIESLREAFRQGADIHARTASEVFGVPIEGMDPMVRRSAKAINFGIVYGMSAFGLAQQLGIPQREAQAYIEAYFARYPGIRAYMERTKAECREKGYVETLFGRRCHMPGINERNPAHRGLWERAAINAPIQGGAADIIRRAMVRMGPALTGRGLGARMLLQVHDELVFEVPEKEIEETASLVAEVMEGAASLSVPLTVECGFARHWDEAH